MEKLDNLSVAHLLKETCINLLLEALIEYIEQGNPDAVDIKTFIGMQFFVLNKSMSAASKNEIGLCCSRFYLLYLTGSYFLSLSVSFSICT